ncbi:MAG: DUF3127 domain-containing protein [Alloprevotella sp.]|nr:DUF3127 domain-containing protein [Alloprevotella sp.]
MNITAKVKKIYPPETFAFEDGRTYTQQLIILDCGEYNRSTGEYYENDIPIYFGERNLNLLAAITEGAKVEVHFGLRGRAYTYTDKKDNVTQREGYSLKANAYDIKVLEQSQLVQAVQQSMPQAPMQAPTAQQCVPQPQQCAPQPQQQTPQPQPESEDALPF